MADSLQAAVNGARSITDASGTYTVFVMAVALGGCEWEVWKRYSEFDGLRQRVVDVAAGDDGSGGLPLRVDAPFPPKRWISLSEAQVA